MFRWRKRRNLWCHETLGSWNLHKVLPWLHHSRRHLLFQRAFVSIQTRNKAWNFCHCSCRCCSYVGRLNRFIQPLSVGSGCRFTQTVHEIGHALGFWHEQNRPDRDKYVTINLHNVQPEYASNFDKLSSESVNSLGQTYDFNSIMHYGDTDFAIPGTKSITSKEPGIPIGQSTGLSPLDIQQTQLLYRNLCSKSAVW